MQNFLKINDNDKVVVALNPIPAGETVAVEVQGQMKQISALEEIPAGHKMAICDIPAGGEIIKYGYRIGYAKEDIKAGAWIHTHNIKTALGDLLEYTYEPVQTEEKKSEDVTFLGFKRPDGKVGVRNEIWVIPTVGCVNGVAKHLVRNCEHLVGGSLEKITAFCHPLGCSQCGPEGNRGRGNCISPSLRLFPDGR